MAKLSLAKLERHLYSAADRLRQEGLDAATYKDYIFGMLFLKRCSDVWRTEHDALVARKMAQGVSPEEAEAKYGENHDYYDSFFVPERARWAYLQEKLNDATELYGSVLDKALGALGYNWGSCGKTGTVFFNWRLLQLPARLADYVICHELIHLRAHHHGPAFWALLDSVQPDWRERKDELAGRAQTIRWFGMFECSNTAGDGQVTN